jgi:uncharacterized membrane protein
MAIDHASFFIARVHASESWALQGEYASLMAFVTRWVTHLCAPGFFMLMGAGMVWLAQARSRDGWTPARIRRFFVTRGLVLLLIQQVIENPAWLLGIVSAAPGASVEPPAIGGSDEGVFVVLLVVSALGVSMMFWGLLIRLPSLLIGAITVAAFIAGCSFIPPPSEIAVLFPVPLRIFFIPGTTAPVSVVYSWVPWLVPAGLGVLLGRAVLAAPDRTRMALPWVGLAALAVFVVLRAAGLGDYHQPGPGFIGFMNLTKYPPSLDFLLATLGVNVMLVSVLTPGGSAPADPPTRSLAGAPPSPLRSRGSLATARSLRSALAEPLEVFGRSPLFFYLLHLYVFGVISWAFPRGTTWFVMYLVWAAAVAAMYPACRWYAGFKARKPIESLWRLL